MSFPSNDNDINKGENPEDIEQAVPEATQEFKPENESKPDYLEQLQRLQAEFVNYKKRVERQQKEWHDYSLREVMNSLLPIMDDFEFLFQHHADENMDLPYTGVRLIYTKFNSALEKMGLEMINAEKVQFDPELHEAVLMEHSEEAEHGEILQVWQKGYTFKGKLLRPARVKVAKKKDYDV